MKRSNTCLLLVLAGGLAAADKPKMMNVQGRVGMLDQKASTITVETGGGVRRQVVYSNETKFLYGHSKKSKPGSSEQVKESNYISCAGSYGDKMQLNAAQCVYREAK